MTSNKPKFEPIFFRAPNNYDIKQASDEATIELDPESLTVQSQAEDADINILMKRYGITGKMPDEVRIPTYGDFTGVRDYRTALEAVQQAQASFMELPAELRARWDNDPQKFMEYAADGRNLEEMRKFGLAKPAVPEAPLSRDTQAIVDALKPKTVEPPKSGGTT